jgi:putative glutamine amidotransferase
MRRPIILITTSNQSNASLEQITGDTDILYSDKATANAVIAAGGLPLYISSMGADEDSIEHYLRLADGVLITGANTGTNPRYYGETVLQESQRVDDERDKLDIALIKAAYKKKLPLLAICKGMQVTNVAFGGSLYQKVTTQHPGSFDHDPEKNSRAEITHAAKVINGSILKSIFGSVIATNSSHEQAIKKLAPNLISVAVAEDGIIEAFEGENYPFLLGVQFHAELRPADKQYRSIFDKFIASTVTNEQ